MSVKMRSRRAFLRAAGVPLSAGLLGGSAQRMKAESGSAQAATGASLPIEVANGASPVRVKEVVLFPFDDHSIPFSWGLKLDLIMGKNPGAVNPVVLRPGPPGSPDSASVRYYGTVIKVDDELRMWYLGNGDKRKGGLLPLYAVSKDGIHWEKPQLGLVEYNSSKQNNLVQLLEDKYSLSEHVVIYDPDDSESRRFKMAYETNKYNNRLAVAFSPDGLRWTEYPRNPVGPWLEESGLIKYNGCYYVNGQGGGLYGGGRLRTMTTVASCDFEHWTDACAMSFRRGSTIDLNLRLDRWNTFEEVHLGASLMNRGNMIMGIYGMWHGDPTGDRSRVTMDLGLIVSNDAIHFSEPIPDFRFIPAREEQEVATGRAALAQGQGMVNLGDKTHYWYEAWGQPAGGVRMATWERDRFGFFRAFDKEMLPRDPHGRSLPAHFISCPMKLDQAGAGVFVNADGLSNNSELTVELLDHTFQRIPGYSGADCIPIRTSGMRQAANWRTKQNLEAFSHPLRVRVNFGGIRPEDVKLYAVYVGGVSPID